MKRAKQKLQTRKSGIDILNGDGSEMSSVIASDSSFEHNLEALDESLSLGEITRVFPNHFPTQLGEEETTTPFRRWMLERILVAERAVGTAAQGHINPTPGKHCQYCPIAHSCAASTEREGGL